MYDRQKAPIIQYLVKRVSRLESILIFLTISASILLVMVVFFILLLYNFI